MLVPLVHKLAKTNLNASTQNQTFTGTLCSEKQPRADLEVIPQLANVGESQIAVPEQNRRAEIPAGAEDPREVCRPEVVLVQKVLENLSALELRPFHVARIVAGSFWKLFLKLCR